MGKYIISQQILGQRFSDIAVKHANHIIKNDPQKIKNIQKELNNVETAFEFVDMFEKYFKGEIKIKL